MAINDWPTAERPRERLLLHGPQALSDAELLAILLRSGARGKTAVDLARGLLAEFGGLRGLFAAEQGRLCAAPGLGPAKYAELQAVLEMARRHLGETLQRGNPLADPRTTRQYLTACLRDRPSEVFCCLYLDNRHRVIAFEELFYGTLDGASVHPREVLRKSLNHNAAAVIFAHNHPSGVAEPSDADRRLTQKLKEGLALVDIRVLDHFVVGDGEAISFAERGWL